MAQTGRQGRKSGSIVRFRIVLERRNAMGSVPQNVTLWKYRRIPYTFESGYPYKDDVREAMKKWADAAGVSFPERVKEANYLVIRQPTGGSSSSIGMQGGPQDVYINAG